MGAQTHDGLAIPRRVVLAHEPRFRVGDIDVDPALRHVCSGAASQTIEPRVMQVLVALARAGGAISTRDELVELCWDGRIVGDDAINRVISRIRRLAADIGRGSFAVETIPRVGYRLLDSSDASGGPAAQLSPSPAARLDRRALIGGAAAIAAIGIAAAVGRLGRSESAAEPPAQAKALYDRALAIRQDGVLANRQALAYLREAVRLSPSYGEAWGALAFVYRAAISNEAPERTAGFEERLSEAVRQAEKYDPGNGDAAAAMLPADLPFGRWSEFEAIYRSAIQRHPGHGAAYSLLGSLMMETGRWSDAVAVLKAAKARSPSAPLLRYRLITALWSAGRITAAEQEIDLAMRIWPQHGAIWQTKIKLLALTGRSREALALANDTAAKPLDQPSTQNHSGRLLFLEALATGTRVDVEKALESNRSAARSNQLDRVNIAVQASVLGDPGLALDLLEGAYLERGEWRTGQSARDWVSTHPLFQPHARRLWPEPRFEAILTAVGLEQYWRRAKVVPDYRRAA